MTQGSNTPLVIIGVAVLILLGISQSFFLVDQTERGLLLQLGDPVQKDLGPGLHFKIPFIQKAVTFDHRVLEYDARPEEVVTKEKKTLMVDNYARWRIADPLAFYRSAGDIPGGVSRLNDIIYSELRVALGKHTLNEIVTTQRNQIMHNVASRAREELKDFGIEVLDVRIKRTDLPEENQKAIFSRMRSEREQEAKQYRAEGREKAEEIRAKAEKERAIMLSEARREAAVTRGEGDAEATRIYSRAHDNAAEFYSFTRSLRTYRESLGNKTRILLTPDSELLRYFPAMDGGEED